MRFRFIEDRRADYPVTIMCEVLAVSPAGYYAWRARRESRRSIANRELVNDIKRVHRDACGRYDRGVQYASAEYHKTLQSVGFRASMSRRADCYDTLRWKASSIRSKLNSSITSNMQHVMKPVATSLLTSKASTTAHQNTHLAM